jgi:hypothetical protein
VLWIRDVYSGFRIRVFSILDPNFFHPGSRIRLKKFKYFNLKKGFLSTPDPGSRGQKGTGSRIRIRNNGTSLITYLFFSKATKMFVQLGSGSGRIRNKLASRIRNSGLRFRGPDPNETLTDLQDW